MIISGITAEDLEAARDVASSALGNDLIFSEFESYKPRRHRVRLQVRDSDDPGARRHSHLYQLGYGRLRRRSRFACGHAYGFLFVAIYEREPRCLIKTAFARYRDVWEFLTLYRSVLDRNVGSRMLPLRYGHECTCLSDDLLTDSLQPWLWYRGEAALPTTENVNREERTNERHTTDHRRIDYPRIAGHVGCGGVDRGIQERKRPTIR